MTFRKAVELADDPVRLGRLTVTITPALMGANRLQQVAGAPVMEKEKALPEAPQRRGAKFSRPGLTRRNSVGQPRSHVMKHKIREKIYRLITQRRDRRIAGLKCRRVTEFASDRAEQNFSARDRLGAAWRIG